MDAIHDFYWQFGIDLKTRTNPKGIFTEQEIYDMLMVLFTCVFINVQPEHCWALRTGAVQVSNIINPMIIQSLETATPTVSAFSLMWLLLLMCLLVDYHF